MAIITTSATITPQSSAPGSPTEGQIYYDTEDKKAYVWAGAWKALNNATRSSATGGNTISTYTSDGATYRYHIFTATGTFTPTTAFNIEYLAIAGGGGGGDGWRGGGGGAGGYRNSVPGEKTGGDGNAESAVGVVAQAYTITVGNGGAGGAGANGTNGQDSSIAGSGFTTITATGGGGGGGNYAADADGNTGGSGGGGGGHASDAGEGGAVSSPTQGFVGGNGLTGNSASIGGGGGGAGGAGYAGGTGTSNTVGDGGVGLSSSITNSAVMRGGGGGAGNYDSSNVTVGGSGGGGAGGTGNPASPGPVAGTANTGGGGGGQSTAADGAAGGSGIVIIRYVYEESDGYVSNESVNYNGQLSHTAPVFGQVRKTDGALTTTSTSLIDLTGATLTVTTGAFPLAYSFVCNTRTSTSARITINIDLDGGLLHGISGIGTQQVPTDTVHNLSFSSQTVVLSAASHTIKVKWKTTTGTATLDADTYASYTWSVHEIR